MRLGKGNAHTNHKDRENCGKFDLSFHLGQQKAAGAFQPKKSVTRRATFSGSSSTTTSRTLGRYYYVAYLKDDPAEEPVATSYSSPGVLAEAAHKTGRAKADFELREISREEYERFKSSIL
jgi:hypothetical protein